MSNSLSQATNSLLTQLVMELKSGYIRRCESLGLTPEEMQMLNGLTVDDLYYLLNSSVSVLTFQIHHENFALMVQQARREQQRMQRIDRALALGGSIEMMQHFFGLSSVEVSARRRMTGIQIRQGRCSTLSDEDNASLWRQWQKADIEDVSSADGLDVMMLAAEQMDVSLTAVWHAVRSFDGAQTRTVRKAIQSVRNKAGVGEELVRRSA
ncbi:TPA: DUF2857 domain-containing protein [Klebsiella pneumoniae]|uniref:Protein of uncharacterized function (DUF2857) n=1 Tax=Klebsiella pneumoniae subsp. ozaenae TaxID=574 RepID=A0A377Z2F5_KLEPO|nr:DUF2857 domain-containing protein [Klebsiella pneumoniae]STU59835.1 Protein of uncharacterised function (DUF2857) [Klebsiella pneumoniae subsp. ozaenae]VFS27980.1 Protein of uncharacterised function (DUF2857) [Serratia liquefaciens]AYJ92217.1 DUF2857 domain-containing protein [Klebsiella pneumoniae]RLO16979.1 DUF2857 domain-containing protein [Klebsiella pneumoniae]SQC29436.1 Protein of uncharacterised function (DUF2857) [Klebsiella pneumoniae]